MEDSLFPRKKDLYTLPVDTVSLDLFLAQDGDHAAFTRVIKSCDMDVRRFCWWVNPGNYSIDDLVQETFFRAFKGLATFRGESSGRSWLLSITRRVCLDHASYQKKDVDLLNRLAAQPQMLTFPDSSLELVETLALLPLEFREAFMLVRVFGYTYSEVATILQCPQGTVQSRVARAREMLREHLSPKPRWKPISQYL